jgi:hypothetical protein
MVDELRIGHTWAGVTPLPPIALSITLAGNNAVITWPTNGSAGFTLQSSMQLGNGSIWASIGPDSIQGTNHTLSVAVSHAPQYFRLIK